jgi:hypothetical protein
MTTTTTIPVNDVFVVIIIGRQWRRWCGRRRTLMLELPLLSFSLLPLLPLSQAVEDEMQLCIGAKISILVVEAVSILLCCLLSSTFNTVGTVLSLKFDALFLFLKIC